MGSGHARTREEQILGLARNAIGQIEDWMVEQRKENGWFDAKSTTAEAPDTGAAQAVDATNEVAG